MRKPTRSSPGLSLLELLAVLGVISIAAVGVNMFLQGTARSVKSANQSMGYTVMASFVDQYFRRVNPCEELGIMGPQNQVLTRLPSDAELCEHGGLPDELCSARPASLKTCATGDVAGSLCAAPYPFKESLRPTRLETAMPDAAKAGFSILPSNVGKLGASAPGKRDLYILNVTMSGSREVGGSLTVQQFPLLVELRGESAPAAASSGSAPEPSLHPRDIVSCTYTGASAALEPENICIALGWSWTDNRCNPQAPAAASTDEVTLMSVDLSDYEKTEALRKVPQNRVIACQSGGRVLSCKRDRVPGTPNTCIYLVESGGTPKSAGSVRATVRGVLTTPAAYVVKEGWMTNNTYCEGVFVAKQGVDPTGVVFGEEQLDPADLELELGLPELEPGAGGDGEEGGEPVTGEALGGSASPAPGAASN